MPLRDPLPDPDAAQRPSVLGRRHAADALAGHFALGRSLPVRPDGWATRELDGWTLAHDRGLPVDDLVDAGGRRVGWLLGHPLDLEAASLAASFALPGETQAPGFLAGAEAWLYRHGGRWAAVLLQPVARLFLDPFGALPAFYGAEQQLVASSPFLFSADPTSLSDSPLVDVFRVARADGDYSFVLGTSPVVGVERVPANHVLDLSAWAVERTWPRERPAESSADEAVHEIAETLTATMTSLTTLRPNASLTGGGDTRVLLACARAVAADLSFFTVALPDQQAAVDVRTAAAIAGRFGLDHRVLPWRTPTEHDVELFLYRTGCSVGERRGRLAGPTYAQLGGSAPYVSGISNFTLYPEEIGWYRGAPPDERPTPDALLRRFGLPPHPELVQRAAAWLADLPPLDAVTTLALFNEERVSAWAAGLTLAYPEACSFTAYPSSHRRIGEAALRVGWRDRLPAIRTAIVRERWPELLELGINPSTPAERLRRRTRHAVALVRGAARRARRTLTR